MFIILDDIRGYLKGAPERVLENCTHVVSGPDCQREELTNKIKQKIMKENDRLAAEGLVLL